MKIEWNEGGYPSARTDVGSPLAKSVIGATTNALGHAPIVLPSFGGSVPMYLFPGPSMIVPIANHDNNQHGANENIRLQNLWDGIELYAALFATVR
jgi:acetylornithine deacetylase/succinyl-diaminopimelate desuccinylase-like protein